MWTTHGHHANWIFCLVRTDATVKRQSGCSFLLINMKQPGVTVRPIFTLAGDHEVNQVFLDNAEALVAHRIGQEGEGWTITKCLLENERGGSCFAPKLLADLDDLRSVAEAEPSGTGGVIWDCPQYRSRLARLRIEAQALEITELRILSEQSQGRRPGPQTSLVKLIAANLRQNIDQLEFKTFGYSGLQLPRERPLYGNESPKPVCSKTAQLAAPRYLNSRAWSIFGGTNEIQLNVIAKTVLNL